MAAAGCKMLKENRKQASSPSPCGPLRLPSACDLVLPDTAESFINYLVQFIRYRLLNPFFFQHQCRKCLIPVKTIATP